VAGTLNSATRFVSASTSTDPGEGDRDFDSNITLSRKAPVHQVAQGWSHQPGEPLDYDSSVGYI
jgi:hypothetical protein